MKFRINIKPVLACSLILAAVFISGCQDELTPKEQAESLLTSGTWDSPVVSVDGVDYTNLYTNFSIVFKGQTYTSYGGSPLWPASGTWQIRDDAGKILELDGKLEMHISSLTEADLELTFEWESSTFASGRVKSVGGTNIFKLKKK